MPSPSPSPTLLQQREADTLAFLARAQSGQVRFSNATGYDAVVDQGRRKRPSGVNRSEDQELTPFDRWRLYTAGRDITRNAPAVAFAVRKHLDYVSKFSWRNKTKDPRKKELLRELLKEWSRPANCDVAGRHSLLRMARLFERSRTVDGDILICKIADGRLQAVEADRVRTPPGGFPAIIKQRAIDFLHGVQSDEAGKALNYSVCRRARASDYMIASGMFYFEALVPSDACWHHGYFDRVDQLRGVSPLAGAINTFRDVYEGCDYALAKLKTAQLFGLATYRDSDQSLGNVTPQQTTDPLVAQAGSQMIYDDTPEPSGYRVDFGRGPFHLDLEREDEAEFLTNDTPGPSMQEFVKTMIEMGLKALDIPFSFFNEAYTNYSGQRQAWVQYSLSAEQKRQDNVDLLDEILVWRIGLWIEDGDLPGVLEDYAWEWVPTAAPWIDPLKEVQADTSAVGAAFTSRTRVCRETGADFYEIADELAAENKYLEDRGLNTTMNPANVQITEMAGAGT